MTETLAEKNAALFCVRDCEGCGVRATWIVLWINVGMFLLKALFAMNTHSRSLSADALESLGDIAITGLVLYSLRIVAKDSDEKHPYGYGKVEFLIATVINFLLLTGALVFTGASIYEMFNVGPEKPPSLLAALVAAVSIGGNYIAYRYCKCAGEKIHSQAVLANGAVNWADAATSIAVVAAVIAANMGFSSFDYIVGILIGIWIASVALNGLQSSIRELLDFSPGEQADRIEQLAREVAGVLKVLDVKTRLVGRKLWVDMEVLVREDQTLGEGLKIAGKIKQAVFRDQSRIANISVRLATAGAKG
ncbi:MAG: cation diffusion facilitator family transporter [Elusimicrobiota bacterium]|nr:cation diffusion facilitator family transporter [Elusimicrobiota bacterium]